MLISALHLQPFCTQGLSKALPVATMANFMPLSSMGRRMVNPFQMQSTAPASAQAETWYPTLPPGPMGQCLPAMPGLTMAQPHMARANGANPNIAGHTMVYVPNAVANKFATRMKKKGAGKKGKDGSGKKGAKGDGKSKSAGKAKGKDWGKGKVKGSKAQVDPNGKGAVPVVKLEQQDVVTKPTKKKNTTTVLLQAQSWVSEAISYATDPEKPMMLSRKAKSRVRSQLIDLYMRMVAVDGQNLASNDPQVKAAVVEAYKTEAIKANADQVRKTSISAASASQNVAPVGSSKQEDPGADMQVDSKVGEKPNADSEPESADEQMPLHAQAVPTFEDPKFWVAEVGLSPKQYQQANILLTDLVRSVQDQTITRSEYVRSLSAAIQVAYINGEPLQITKQNLPTCLAKIAEKKPDSVQKGKSEDVAASSAASSAATQEGGKTEA